MRDEKSLLVRGLAALDLEFDGQIVEKLVRYIEQIERWNPLYGLVSASGDELVIKHILDSLGPWRILQDFLEGFDAEQGASGAVQAGKSSVSDIGTGAGLPGIPLSILMPDRRFRLIERMGKRISFLESQKALLSLDNVEVIESEVERAKGPHDVVIFRAFRPFSESKLFRSVWKSLSPGGALFAYKGRQVNTRMELASLAADPLLADAFGRVEIRPVWVPFLEEERCVVIVRKPR